MLFLNQVGLKPTYNKYHILKTHAHISQKCADNFDYIFQAKAIWKIFDGERNVDQNTTYNSPLKSLVDMAIFMMVFSKSV